MAKKKVLLYWHQAIWLSPIYKSPMKDFGYDISDFKDVDPTFGTLEDFNSLVKAAHDLGMYLYPSHFNVSAVFYRV